jgi:hypothetical protein
MRRYRVRAQPAIEDGWIAVALELPNCWSRAATRDDALARLRDEIRYRIEYCPCTGVDDDFVQIEVVEPGAHPTVPRWESPRGGEGAQFTGVAGCPGPRPTHHGPPEVPDADRRPAARTPGWKRWDDPLPRGAT